jgi:transcriptional regulator with XRE-family HTH domain
MDYRHVSKRCNINAANISLLEHDKLEIGKKRILQLANAFGVHPAIIMFPEYESKEILKAA